MVSPKKKRISGKIYWYAVKMARIDGKPKQIWQMYLGTAESIAKMEKRSEDKPYVKLRSFQYGKIAALLSVSDGLNFVEIVNKHTNKKILHSVGFT